MKILSGNYSRDAGAITINGRMHELRTPADALALGIRMLPQEFSIFPDLTVAENIMIAALPRTGLRVDRRALESRAAALLKRMGLEWLPPETRMGDLSHHVQRIVEIARAMNGEARILIMDEPTASLAADEVQMLFAIIRRLQSEGISVIYISHYLKEVFAIASRIVVLRDGRNAGDFATGTTDVDAVLHAIVGNRVGDLYPAFSANAASATEIVTVKGLSVEGWLRGVDFSIRRGTITGVHGLVGSGVEMIGRALFGGSVPRATADSVTIDGRPYRISNPGRAVQAGLGLVAAERKREGIISMLSLRENMSVANMPLFTSGLTVDRKKEVHTTRRLGSATDHPGARHRTADRHAFRRQPAKSLPGPLAARQSQGADPRRADPRRRRRRPAGDLSPDTPSRRRRAGHPSDFLGCRRGRRSCRPLHRGCRWTHHRNFDQPVAASVLMGAASKSAIAA